MDTDRLAELAQELICRVRDDDPEANGRWLLSATSEADRFALLFVMAAAIPDDVPWSVLTDWIGRRSDASGRQILFRPHGTLAAVRRHQTAREPLCALCKAIERERGAARRAAAKVANGSSTASCTGLCTAEAAPSTGCEQACTQADLLADDSPDRTAA